MGVYGRLQQDADISSGTFDEIKTLLKEKKNREGISNYAVGHTEAFERGGLLLVLSWDGNPEGNVYDVRARLFKRDSELCGMAWVDDSGCLLAVDNLREPSARYTKISDRIVCFISSCVGYYDANGVWLRVEYMDRGRSILKLF